MFHHCKSMTGHLHLFEFLLSENIYLCSDRLNNLTEVKACKPLVDGQPSVVSCKGYEVHNAYKF